MLQLTRWYLLNIYILYVRKCTFAHVQCWREFAKCLFAHFPSFFSAHVDTYVTGIDVLSCRPISNWAGEYPHSSVVVRYANNAPYGSTDFFSIAFTAYTGRSALPLL